MKHYKGIIFDLDGVLVHTDRFHYLAWKALADRLGIPFDERKNDRCRGVSRMESLEILLEGSSCSPTEEEKEAWANEKNEHYRAYLLNMTPDDVETDVRQFLCEVRRRGYKTAIGSSSRNAKLILERTQIDDLFDAVTDGCDIIESKPSPQVFLTAAEKLGLSPAQCLVVEDAPSGVIAAQRGDFDCACVGAAARISRPTYAICHLYELLPYFPEKDPAR